MHAIEKMERNYLNWQLQNTVGSQQQRIFVLTLTHRLLDNEQQITKIRISS